MSKITKTAATKTVTVTPIRLGKAGIAVLNAIKNGAMTRAEISHATGIKSGFCSLLGHVDASKTEPSSLSHKGYLTVQLPGTDGKSASSYAITDKGREALKAATTPVAATPKTEEKPKTEPKAAAKKAAPAKK